MTKQFSLSTLAAAILVLGTSSAFAQDSFSLTETDTIDYTNVGYGEIWKRVNVEKDVLYHGDVQVEGTIAVDAAAFGMTDNKQILENNAVNMNLENSSVTNTSTIDASAAGSTGSIGVNVATGDVNAQDNAVAIAYADMAAVMGSADATAFAYQKTDGNDSKQFDTDNTATISGGSFDGASGILGANATAGNFNAQKNNAVVAVSSGKLAEADVWAKQEVLNAVTDNWGEQVMGSGTSAGSVIAVNPVMNTASLAGSFNAATGVIGVNISGGTNNLQANTTTVAATIASLGGL